MTIVLAISLVCLIIYPIPTFTVPVGGIFLASHIVSLCTCTISYYTFFVWHTHFNIPVLVMLLSSSVLRQVWRPTVNEHNEISFMCAICILIVDVVAVFYMWLPGEQWVSAIVLVPTAMWDMHLVHYSRPTAIIDVESLEPIVPKKPGLKIPRIGVKKMVSVV